MVNLFIQEHSGDYNFEKEFNSVVEAEKAAQTIKTLGGYTIMKNSKVQIFVPWHCIDFVRIEE